MKPKKNKIPRFGEHFGLNIEKISIIMQRRVLNIINENQFDISFAEFLVLVGIADDREPMSLILLSKLTGKDKSLTSRLVKNLEDKKLTTRKSHPLDGRSEYLLLTSKGLELLDTVGSIMKPLDQKIAQDIGRKEFQVFENTLKEFLKHIES